MPERPVETYRVAFENELLGCRTRLALADYAEETRQQIAEEMPRGSVVLAPCWDCDGQPVEKLDRSRDCPTCWKQGWLPYEVIACPECEDGKTEERLPATSPVQIAPRFREVRCEACNGSGNVIDYEPYDPEGDTTDA